MMRSYKFRLYPNEKQRSFISKTLGSSRLVYNYYLDLKKKEYEETGKSKGTFDCLKDLKNLYETYPFLKEVDSMSLRCALFDLEDAFVRMYKQKSGYPHFKSKDKKNSYRTNMVTSQYKGNKYENIKVDLKNKTITLPKLKEVKLSGYRNLDKLEGRIINATVSRESSGKFYVSVLVEETNRMYTENQGTIIGIDLGVKNIITTSNHEVYENNKILEKHERRLKRYQKPLSRKVKGSNNYYKQKQKLARLYEKIKNTRKYLLHHISKQLTDENDVIVTETLDIKEMTTKDNHNKSLIKRILDVSFYELTGQIKYKSEWKGNTYIQINKYYPSSQICHKCEYQNKEIKDLSIREWECPNCYNINDRDINASENILYEGLRKYLQILNKEIEQS